MSSYELYHWRGNICVHFVYSASFGALGIIEKLLLKDLCSQSAAGMAKGLGGCCFLGFFPLHTHRERLFKEIGNVKRNIRLAARYVQKILLFMLICANQMTSSISVLNP